MGTLSLHLQRGHMKSFPRTWNHVCARLTSKIVTGPFWGFDFSFFVSTVTEGMWEHALRGADQLVLVTSELQWKGHPHGEKQSSGVVWGTPSFRHPAWDFFFKSLLSWYAKHPPTEKCSLSWVYLIWGLFILLLNFELLLFNYQLKLHSKTD